MFANLANTFYPISLIGGLKMSTFKELISKHRREKGLTLRELGKLTGISPSYLSEIEQGVKLPPKDKEKLKKLAEMLGIKTDLLIRKALKERAMGKVTDIISKIFAQDDELALSLYREKGGEDNEITMLQEMLKKTFMEWEEKCSHE